MSGDRMSFSPHITAMDCFIYRCIAVIFTSVSILCAVFNLRFILLHRNRLNPLALSLIINSLVLVLFSSPYIVFQAVQCYPVRSYFVCLSQGFACFTSGVCVMYTMSLFALIQYIRLFYNRSFLYRILEDRRSHLIPLACWFTALLWSFPPLLHVQPGYTREGQGFDCSLNWRNTTKGSQCYIFLAFIGIYFLPLLCLIYTNLRIFNTIRRLIHRRPSIDSNTAKTMSVDVRHNLIHMFTVAESNRLKRLRIDRRFAQATMITVLHYMFTWTPYAMCALAQMVFALASIDYELPGMLLTGAALTAKLGVIAQSCVYFFTVRPLNRRFSLSSATLK